METPIAATKQIKRILILVGFIIGGGIVGYLVGSVVGDISAMIFRYLCCGSTKHQPFFSWNLTIYRGIKISEGAGLIGGVTGGIISGVVRKWWGLIFLPTLGGMCAVWCGGGFLLVAILIFLLTGIFLH